MLLSDGSMCQRNELDSLRITDIHVDELDNQSQMKIHPCKSKTDQYHQAIFYTLFTIYPRIIHRGKNSGMPGAIHLHTLLFRQVLRLVHLGGIKNLGYIANSRVSPYLSIFSGCTVIPAIFLEIYTASDHLCGFFCPSLPWNV